MRDESAPSRGQGSDENVKPRAGIVRELARRRPGPVSSIRLCATRNHRARVSGRLLYGRRRSCATSKT
jgi:hypothetical protein